MRSVGSSERNKMEYFHAGLKVLLKNDSMNKSNKLPVAVGNNYKVVV